MASVLDLALAFYSFVFLCRRRRRRGVGVFLQANDTAHSKSLR